MQQPYGMEPEKKEVAEMFCLKIALPKLSRLILRQIKKPVLAHGQTICWHALVTYADRAV